MLIGGVGGVVEGMKIPQRGEDPQFLEGAGISSVLKRKDVNFWHAVAKG